MPGLWEPGDPAGVGKVGVRTCSAEPHHHVGLSSRKACFRRASLVIEDLAHHVIQLMGAQRK